MSYTKEEIKEGLEILGKINHAAGILDTEMYGLDELVYENKGEECPKEWIELINESAGLLEESTHNILDIYNGLQDNQKQGS